MAFYYYACIQFFYFKSEKEVDFTVYNERQLTGYFFVTIFRVHLYKIIIFYMCALKSILKERRSRGFWAKITKITIYIFWMKRAWKIIKSQKKLKKVEKSPKKSLFGNLIVYTWFSQILKIFLFFHYERSNDPIFIGIETK